MSVDAGFGSSVAGVCLLQLSKCGIIQVLYCQEIEGNSYEDSLDLCYDLVEQYSPSRIWVDNNNPEIITSLKRYVNDELPWKNQIERLKSIKPKMIALEESSFALHKNMRVVPFNFPNTG